MPENNQLQGPLEKRKFVQAGLEQGWVDPLAFARRFNCTNREECQAAMTRIVNAVVGSITMESPKTSFIRRTAAAFIAYDWDNVEMQTYWNRRKDIAQIKADVSEQHTIISRQLTEELEPVPKAKRQQQLNTDSSTCTPPPKRRQTLPMDMSYKMHLPALYTPQPTEKLSTSISDDETISGAHLARLRACQDEAPTPVIIAGLDLADKLRVFQRSILRSRTEITQYDTEHFLGAHSCLLISEARPDEYCELFSHEDWCAIREYFEERYLESTKQDGYVERMLGEMYTRKKAVKSWFPTVDQDNEQECRHASSLLRMFNKITLKEPVKINEATWVERYIQPMMDLLDSTGLEVLYDSTTEYNALRPDVHVHLSGGHFQRAVASFEIKSPWASSKETQKDLARVILSCISYHKQDEKHYDTEDEIPANLGVHLAGREGRVYEVFLYKALYLAVEIGDLTVPTVLTRGKIKAIASSVNQWNTLMNRITRTKKNMLRHAIRPRSVSLLPPTPDKKTTKPT